ncbi:MAG: DUF1839 family protein [Deltaproteobacteria bacterium]|nr:DUF1839 family protein [Deltaproteobacteria bacterium]
MTRAQVLPLDAKSYQRHFIHGEERAWTETNCYVDLWIELLHGYGLDPVPALAHTVAIDFEGDGFTFFKPPLEDIEELYGFEVMEHNIWRPLPEHIKEQLALGRPLLIEIDAWFLPDTAGVSYKTDHAKTTVAVTAIDTEAKTLGYFHGRGYYELSGEDYVGALRLELPPGVVSLPPYTEIAKTRHLKRPSRAELTAISLKQLARHRAAMPTDNPMTRFGVRLVHDIEWLKTQPLQAFHQYSFATVRQLGSCAEVTASYMRWLGESGVPGLEPAAGAYDEISATCKTMQFRLARVANTKKPWDASASVQTLADSWALAKKTLTERVG